MGHPGDQRAVAESSCDCVSCVALGDCATWTWASWLQGQVTAGCSVLLGVMGSGGATPYEFAGQYLCPPHPLCDHLGDLAGFFSRAPTSLVAGLED